jgi:DNA mismatch repair ATPase MutL
MVSTSSRVSARDSTKPAGTCVTSAYVNRQPVRDKLLSHAIAEAHFAALPRGRHPVVILLLIVPRRRST